MLLLFDARYIRTDFHDGISRYSAELARALAELTPITFLIHDPAQLSRLPADCKYILIHAPTSSKEPFTAQLLNRYNPDVVFSPMQTMGAAGRQFKLILTSHDMIYYRHRSAPHSLNPVIRIGWRLYHLSYLPQRIALNSADVVVTVSETSKREFIKAKLTNRPIVVVPNAPQRLAELLPSVTTCKDTPKNLIYMGSFMAYKNVETLIKGMEFLPKFTLHLLSRISANRRLELERLIPSGSTVVFHNGVSDEVYAQLLANDAVLVTASLDEGYGLPIAEALELGVPAVVSDLPIFHEVAGDGALYFEPEDARDFSDKVLQLNDSKIRQQVVMAGKKHIALFSWNKSAQTLLHTIKSSLLQ